MIKRIQNSLARRTITFMEKVLKNGIFLFEHELWMASLFEKETLDATLSLARPSSVLDLGCGVGRALDYFVSNGIDARGVEGSSLAISKAKYPELITRYNLNKVLNLRRKFDLVWSFEFVEHIHPKFTDNLMKTFSNHSDTVIISAARPGQGGDRHFNEQSDEYWKEKFRNFGYQLEQDWTDCLRNTPGWFRKNMYAFKR